MPSTPPRFIPRALTVTELRKFVPQSWKQPPRSVQEILKPHDESVPEALSKSLGHFIAKGHLCEAFRTFSLLRDQSSLADTSPEFVLRSVVSLLSTCVKFDEFVPGQQIHAQCVLLGLEFYPVLVPKLVTFYSTFNLLDEAQTITESSDVLHPLPWNVLIGLYVGRKRFEEAVSAYKRMVSRGIRPDAFTYPSVLKACGALHDFASGRVVHASIEVSPHRRSLCVCNALISMYRRFGRVDIARKLFDRMSERDAVSWNAVINCYRTEREWEELVHRMQCSGVELNVVTWNTIVKGYLQTGNYVEALNIIAKMRNRNVSLDPVAIVNELKLCSHFGAIHCGKELHCLAIRRSYDQIDNVQNSLITMYSRCHDLWHAIIVFQQIEAKSVSTWNSIISGCVHSEILEETFFFLKEMLLAGFHPNYITLTSILGLCAQVENLQHGKELHCYIVRRQSFNNNCLILWNSLVDMYAKSGKIVAAQRVYESMSKWDKVTYTSLINGYGMLGEGDVAVDCFKYMLRSGIEPDHITMVAVLSACSHSKLVSEGEKLFEKMQHAFSVDPRLEHFSCMVDLYCRVGSLAKAKNIICKSPYKPSSAMCATLLIACLSHGNTQIGEWAADKLLETKSENPGHYLLIKDMYAFTGSSKLAEVERIISEFAVHEAHEFDLVETESVKNGSSKAMTDTVGSCAINQEQSSDEERLAEVG